MQRKIKTIDDINFMLRSVSVTGEICSVAGLEALSGKFDDTAHECDSSAHEVAAIAMRWAAGRIRHLESQLFEVSRAVGK